MTFQQHRFQISGLSLFVCAGMFHCPFNPFHESFTSKFQFLCFNLTFSTFLFSIFFKWLEESMCWFVILRFIKLCSPSSYRFFLWLESFDTFFVRNNTRKCQMRIWKMRRIAERTRDRHKIMLLNRIRWSIF